MPAPVAENLRIGLEKRFMSFYKRNKKDLMSCTGAKSITVMEGPLSVTILSSGSQAD
jgi:hypothetical protein